MKYRQTLIWEFLNKKTLRPIDKLKIMCRLEDKFINIVNIDLYNRAFNLKMSFVLKMTGSQLKYYSTLVGRLINNQISLKEFENNLKNFFNYYKA